MVRGNNNFTLRCENSAGSVQKTVTVKVNEAAVAQRPSCSSAGPDYDTVSGSTTKRYAYGVQNATEVLFPTWSSDFAQDDIIWYKGVNEGNGTWRATINISSHTPIGVKDYNINTHVYLYNDSYKEIWCDTADFKIPSAPQGYAPTVDLRAGNTNLSYGQSTTLTWTTTNNPTSCTASLDWSGSKSVSGGNQNTGNLTSTKTYKITCTNNYGSGDDTVTVSVGNQPPQTCQDPSATNYGGSIPCRYPTQQNAPTINLTADNYNLNYNQSTMLRWTVQNATSCSASGDWSGSKNSSGSSEPTGNLTNTKSYTLRCSGPGGDASRSVTVNVSGQPNSPSVNLVANPSSIQQGQSSSLSWTSQNTTSCSASWTSSTATAGSQPIYPGSTTTYSITCNGNGQQATDTETVSVGTTSNNRPTVDLRADDTSIDSGDETTLEWDSNNADYCIASGGRNGWSGNVNRSDTFDTDDLTRDTTYEIECFNNYGSAEDSVTVRVDDANNGDKPSVTIYANPSNVSYGGASTITWSSTDADTCRANGGTNGWSGSKNRSGTFYTGALSFSTNFGITCENDEGTDSDSTTVTVGGIIQQQNRPTVILYADQTSLPYNGATFVRWSTVGATSCTASGGSTGWAGTKSIGPGSFYTGSLSSSRTFNITCWNSSGSDTDSVTVSVRRPTTGGPTPPPATSLVIINSTIDRNQPIVPTLDNTRPRPGDEITYTVNYQNIGTGAIKNLVLRLDLPYEVNYLFSTPNNPTISGNTLIFNLGTLAANGSGTVTVRVRVRQDAPEGAFLNFPAILSYTDPAGFPQTVTANVSAQVWNIDEQPVVEEEVKEDTTLLGAAAFLSGTFWPNTLFGWLLLIILILLLILLVRYLIAGAAAEPFSKKTTTTTIQH